MHDGNHDNVVDDFDIHDNDDEGKNAGFVDRSASLNALHNIVDATRKRETEDSDFHLGKLFNMNIGAGGRVEITELEDSYG